MIRAGERYNAVIVVTPYGKSPDHPEAHCFMRLNWQSGDRVPNHWHAIGALEAALTIRHAKWKSAEVPKDDFASLEDVTAWIQERQAEEGAAK